MDDIIVGIHQPNFMPWLGYFYKLYKSDVFIFLDDVQFQKTGANYTNRVSINMNGKSQYLTIPVKRYSGTWKINETQFNDEKWKKKVIGSLQSNYGKAKHFKENKDFIFDLINHKASNLAEYNIKIIKEFAIKLDITTKMLNSSDYKISTSSTQRLIDLIKNVGGNIYLSGSGGDNYQEHSMYEQANIKLIYNKIPFFQYEQYKSSEFIAGLSIVDAIFNIGFERLKKEFFNEEK
jgi:hypothetical protein